MRHKIVGGSFGHVIERSGRERSVLTTLRRTLRRKDAEFRDTDIQFRGQQTQQEIRVTHGAKHRVTQRHRNDF